MYLMNPLTKELAVAHNWDDVIKLSEQGYVKIGRAQWRQLKREQKKAQKESELALQYADTTEHHNWVMGT